MTLQSRRNARCDSARSLDTFATRSTFNRVLLLKDSFFHPPVNLSPEQRTPLSAAPQHISILQLAAQFMRNAQHSM